MRRVLVIGPCGSGKSTLATMLARRLGLPLFHIDQLNWKSGWVESTKDELREKLRAIAVTDRWLIDGNYGGTLDERLPRADTIVYLDFPIWLCLWRLGRRIATHRGRSRPDMPDGCPERFDVSFFVYLLTWNLGPRPRTEAKLKGHEHKIIRLPNPKALAAWLKRVESSRS
ncbi:AAA family ATPase [Sphingomonas sp.]|uniref:AAA family ATPase n=1 Tax=Sphingomonas sp. TaxID=28214 RepID=UPI00286BA061|nr:AAA family ATPase [Sphingomonas sp.]